MPATQQLLIDGQWRDAASGATHDVVHSYTRIGSDKLRNSQLPAQVVTAGGIVLDRPAYWS